MLRLFLSLILFFPIAASAGAEAVHAISIHGDPALAADFSHFLYADPGAPKGGTLRFGVVGTFNNLNSFIIRGKRTTARGMWDPELGNLVIESLMVRSRDEPFTMYGLLAETVDWQKGKYIEFNLNPKARWTDGKPVTADDVIFSFNLLKDKGRPPFSTRLRYVEKMEKTGPLSVRFTFKPEADREFPLLLALSPVLPAHATDVARFEETTLRAPLGSGPYKISEIKPGEKIVFERDPNYWAKDLATVRGLNNFDRLSIEYFAQENSLFEAFKKGEIDLYEEGSPLHWARAYDFPAVRNGDIVRDVFKPRLPANMYAFVFNTRRAKFQDVRVRKALTLAFDFQWLNRNIFENSYTRTESFWQNSDLSSLGKPASALERDILGKAAASIEPDILDGTFHLPVTDASGRDRKTLRQAYDLLTAAGYRIEAGRMIDGKGTPLAFEILCQSQDQEKIAIAFQRTLAALGITVSIRTIEDAQYQERSQRFDFDMTLKTYAASLSPGIEQTTRWGSDARDIEGSDNMAGARDTDIDRVIGIVQQAQSNDEFVAAVRALDRLLLSRYYVIPLYHSAEQRVARWKYISHPAYLPLYGFQLPAWWDERARK